MGYDLFVSYSRNDNQEGRISQLLEQIALDFEVFAGRPLSVFFDKNDIKGMDDWRLRILQGLRESRLMLACLSPAFLKSSYCEWEFNEYLKHEVARCFSGEGVAPIYFVEVPSWNDSGFDERCDGWIGELRRRQQFDLRPWFNEGQAALRDGTVQAQMKALGEVVAERVRRGEDAEKSLGNIDAHSPHFIGRIDELRRLREAVATHRIGLLTTVHGLGGIGKTALAIAYAHAFAYEYGGGRWQVRCENMDDLAAAVATLAAPLDIKFSDKEKVSTELQFQRVMAHLRQLADSNTPHRCLLLLDNVDRPKLLEPSQVQHLPGAEWLHVIATTRLGEEDLFAQHKDREFLPVDELPEEDALLLIESYQRNGRYASEAERCAAREIVCLLGGFTLAVEAAAVYLGHYGPKITCEAFLTRMKKEGLEGLDAAVASSSGGVRHGEIRLAATLRPTFERLSDPERLALEYAALLHADHVVLRWLRALVAEVYPTVGIDSEPGHEDPWSNLLNRLLSLRLLQPTGAVDAERQPRLVRIHRLVQQLALHNLDPERLRLRQSAVDKLIKSRAPYLEKAPDWREWQWEWECVFQSLLAYSPDRLGPILQDLAGISNEPVAQIIIQLLSLRVEDAPETVAGIMEALMAQSYSLQKSSAGHAAFQCARIALDVAVKVCKKAPPLPAAVRHVLLEGCRHPDMNIQNLAVIAVHAVAGADYELGISVIRKLAQEAIWVCVPRPSRLGPLVGSMLTLFLDKPDDANLAQDFRNICRTNLKKIPGLRLYLRLAPPLLARFLPNTVDDYNPFNSLELQMIKKRVVQNPAILEFAGRLIDLMDPSTGSDEDLEALLKEWDPLELAPEDGIIVGFPLAGAVASRTLAGSERCLGLGFDYWDRAKDTDHIVCQDAPVEARLVQMGREVRGRPALDEEWTTRTEDCMRYFFYERKARYRVHRTYLGGSLTQGFPFLARQYSVHHGTAEVPLAKEFIDYAVANDRPSSQLGSEERQMRLDSIMLRMVEVWGIECGTYDPPARELAYYGMRCFLEHVDLFDEYLWNRAATVLARLRTYFPPITDAFLGSLPKDLSEELRTRMNHILPRENIGTLVSLKTERLYVFTLSEPPDLRDGKRAKWQQLLRILIQPCSMSTSIRDFAREFLQLLVAEDDGGMSPRPE